MNATAAELAGIDTAYYADHSRCSHSSLECLRKSPLLYHGRYIAGTIPQKHATAEMRLGTLAMDRIYRPDFFKTHYMLTPKVDRRTKAGKEQWAEFQDYAAGRELIDADTMEAVEKIREGVMRCPQARQIVEAQGEVEQVIEWTDRATGLPCKAKLDKIIGGILINDLKTTAYPTPEAFGKQCDSLGYFRQAAFYLVGLREARGKSEAPLFLFTVVGNDEPFDCFVGEVDDASLAIAERDNEADMAELARRLEENDWTSRYANATQTISLPAWRKR